MDHLINLTRYLAFVVVEGDYLNDWLTHLPSDWRQTVMEIGQIVADFFF